MFYLYSQKINRHPNLICGALLSNYGTLQFNQGEKNSKVVGNRKRYFRDLDINLSDTIFQEQRHTTNIRQVTQKDRGKGTLSPKNIISNNDGLISIDKNVFLCAFTADCVPISFFDPKSGSFGIAHAGWKGALDLFAQKMVERLKKSFKVKSKDLICYLGPSIGVCCYEVSRAGDGRVRKFLRRFGKKVISRKKDEVFLDLKRAIILQLRKSGVLQKNIEVSPVCTCCDEKYDLPSYYKIRFKMGRKLNRSILSVIGIKE
jgi:YfiH family protein